MTSYSAEASKKILRGDILIAVDKQDVSQADVHDVAPLADVRDVAPLVRGPKAPSVLCVDDAPACI
ncbi:hypothetical protein T484DRAFT_1791739 [Baffinella frigidus]|nr:hypothetical protein T484DRAFT_1791739 [Cryptophyta sp. CCMP2293]